ncbi:hypothetical protein GCM10027082_24310 [Comamonas humi]
MANQWLRLWHDMPTDPKWRTIARHAKQPLCLVQAVYLHLLVDASRNVTRGHVDVTPEDLASALDVTEDEIQAVLTAMEGRVLSAGELSGWSKRQPKREDAGDDETGAKSASQRKREQREREKLTSGSPENGACHAESRNVTLDKDKDKEYPLTPVTGEGGVTPLRESLFDEFWKAYPKRVGKDAARKKFDQRKFARGDMPKLLAAIKAQAQSEQWRKDGGQYIPNPATWLNQGRFDDEVADGGVTQSSPLGTFV